MEAIGPDQTDTLLTYLPPSGWADVATARDVAALAAEFRGAIGVLTGEVHVEVSELRSEFGALGSEFGALRGEFGALRGEFGILSGEVRSEMSQLRGEIGQVRGEVASRAEALATEMHRELRLLLYQFTILLVAVLALSTAVSNSGLIG